MDENYEVPKIPFQNPQPKRKTSYIMRIKQGQGAIYRPAHLKTRPDLVPWDRVHTELRLKEKEKYLQEIRQTMGTIGPPQDPIGQGVERGELLTQDGKPFWQEVDFEKGIFPKMQKAKFDQKNMTDRDREEIERLKPMFEQIMPFRHRAIRDALMKVINNRFKFMNLIKIIEDSEVLAEKILQEKYIHYFERYPDLLQAVQKHYEKNIEWYQKIENSQVQNVIIQRPEDEKKQKDSQLLLEGKDKESVEEEEEDIDGVELKTPLDFNPNIQKRGKKQKIKAIKSKYYRK